MAAWCARRRPAPAKKAIADNGTEPISLWVLAACGLVAVIAGGILGGAAKMFSYGSTFREGYVRSPLRVRRNPGPEAKEALAAYMAKGAKIYSAKCNGCHGSDAKGDGANFPACRLRVGHRRNRASCDDHPQRSSGPDQHRQNLRRRHAAQGAGLTPRISPAS
jgi:cytochrome c553